MRNISNLDIHEDWRGVSSCLICQEYLQGRYESHMSQAAQYWVRPWKQNGISARISWRWRRQNIIAGIFLSEPGSRPGSVARQQILSKSSHNFFELDDNEERDDWTRNRIGVEITLNVTGFKYQRSNNWDYYRPKSRRLFNRNFQSGDVGFVNPNLGSE